MKNYCFAFLSFVIPIFSIIYDVDIISSFNIEELPVKLFFTRNFRIRSICPSEYFVRRDPNSKRIAKIIVFDPYFNIKVTEKLPKEKLVLFVWEPQFFSAEFYNHYSKIYTWDDDLIDDVKFFRFKHPYLTPYDGNSLGFADKKTCAIVVGNWTEERLGVVKFFDLYQPKHLDCYGRCPSGLENISMWKGHISGLHTGKEKISTLKNYRFCICFENTVGLQGYITEKIFSCFAAGCIPVYWGSNNITEYIPKTCFIDYRDFMDVEALYQYISTMSEERHQEYVTEIRRYLQSEQAQIFSPEYFNRLICESIIH